MIIPESDEVGRSRRVVVVDGRVAVGHVVDVPDFVLLFFHVDVAISGVREDDGEASEKSCFRTREGLCCWRRAAEVFEEAADYERDRESHEE